jgi:hypothetical protein
MDAVFSKMVKSGKITYFLDVKEAKNNTKYLTMTASQPSKDEPKKFTKSSINVFSNAAEDFVGALKQAKEEMNSERGREKSYDGSRGFDNLPQLVVQRWKQASSMQERSRTNPRFGKPERGLLLKNVRDQISSCIKSGIAFL